jgi:hypothetical protein
VGSARIEQWQAAKIRRLASAFGRLARFNGSLAPLGLLTAAWTGGSFFARLPPVFRFRHGLDVPPGIDAVDYKAGMLALTDAAAP